MSSSLDNRASLAQQLVAGTKQHFSTASSLAFGGATVTPAQIEATLQSLADLRSGVNEAKATTKAKIAAERAQAPSLRSQMAAYVTFVRATFGDQPDVLADFGLQPKKVAAPLTVEEKATAAAKRAATRAARHTMGSRQKKSVKGTITTIVAPAPSAASAPVVQGSGATAPATTPGTTAAAAPPRATAPPATS